MDGRGVLITLVPSAHPPDCTISHQSGVHIAGDLTVSTSLSFNPTGHFCLSPPDSILPKEDVCSFLSSTRCQQSASLDHEETQKIYLKLIYLKLIYLKLLEADQ